MSGVVFVPGRLLSAVTSPAWPIMSGLPARRSYPRPRRARASTHLPKFLPRLLRRRCVVLHIFPLSCVIPAWQELCGSVSHLGSMADRRAACKEPAPCSWAVYFEGISATRRLPVLTFFLPRLHKQRVFFHAAYPRMPALRRAQFSDASAAPPRSLRVRRGNHES